MILHTCPDCQQPFKMRNRGRCPHCATTLLVGDREIHEVSLSTTRGWWWDGRDWINLRELVHPAVR